MFKKLISLSSFILMMSIVPAWAQYSFEKVIGGSDDDRPYGMKQAENNYFYLYGSSGSYNFYTGGNQWYIAKIDHLGNVVWYRTYNNRSKNDGMYDMVELPNGTILFGGTVQEQLQEFNATVAILDHSGNILFDTLYPQLKQQCGSIQSIVKNDDTKQLVTIGLGCLNNNASGILFQTLDYNGIRTSHQMLPYPEEFRTKKIFKLKNQNRYVVFGERKSLNLDSLGNLIEGPNWAIDTNNSFGDRIWDIIQQPDGTFCGLLALGNNIGRYKLQYFDDQGKFQRVSTLVLKPASYLRSLTITRETGYLVAGSDFILIDSNENIVWQKPSRQPVDAETVSIRQASDGGFYGSAVDWTKNSSLDPDIYIFKTSPDGIISSLGEFTNTKLSVQISPNPTNGLLTIGGDFKFADVKIYDVLGQQMRPAEQIEPNAHMDVSMLKDGIYIVTLTSGKGTCVQKVNLIK